MTKKHNAIEVNIAIQGLEGSFHHAAAEQYWAESVRVDCHDTFEGVVQSVADGTADYGLMAIENSIAGSLLQNYRLLRDDVLHVVGEVYLQIRHQLIGMPSSDISDIASVQSHPMAINQCLHYLSQYPQWTLVHANDTAGSVIDIKNAADSSRACIASSLAADIYGMKVLASDIQTHPVNYTRFLVLSRDTYGLCDDDKASIYLTVPDQRGILNKILSTIDAADINLSKLQSYPVMGKLRSYYFHLDLEYQDSSHLDKVLPILREICSDLRVLGRYRRTDHLISI